VLPEIQVIQESKVFRVLKEPRVLKALLVPKDCQTPDFKVLKALLVLLVLQVAKVKPDTKVPKVRLAPMDHLVLMDPRDQRVLKDPKERRVTMAMDTLGHKEDKVRKDLKVLKVLKGPQLLDQLVLMAFQADQANQANQAMMEKMAFQVPLELTIMVILVNQGPQVNRARTGHQARTGQMVDPVPLEIKVRKVTVLLDPKETKGMLETKGSLEWQEKSVLVGPQARQDRSVDQAMQVPKDHQDLMATLGTRVRLLINLIQAIQVLQVLQGPQATSFQASQVLLALLDTITSLLIWERRKPLMASTTTGDNDWRE